MADNFSQENHMAVSLYFCLPNYLKYDKRSQKCTRIPLPSPGGS